MKVCTRCKEEKQYESFSKNTKASDGRQSMCKSCTKEYNTKWRRENLDRHNTSNKKSYSIHKKKYTTKRREWKQLNPALVLAQKAKRRSKKLNATPSWLTQEHHKQIADMYWLAKDLEAISGQQYHVDHIIPLLGDNVCGLHVPWNLQVLPADVNMSKSNKHVA